jgi:3'-phosphoadenosine 5'-phosphosulfate (PAPS) 3'-phosphatase
MDGCIANQPQHQVSAGHSRLKGHGYQEGQVARHWCATELKRQCAELTFPVADLSAQALISLHLLDHFPTDLIIGEEDTSELRANEPLRNKVVGLVNDGFDRVEGWGKGDKFTTEQSVTVDAICSLYLLVGS